MRSATHILRSRRSLSASLLIVAALAARTATAQVTFDWATIGNAGNPADTRVMNKGPGAPADGSSGYGSVGYAYRMSKTHVTNAQYVQFLNAIDPSGANTLRAYNSAMNTFAAGNVYAGGITLNAAGSTGAKYTVKSGYDSYPAVWINWNSAARFANWLHNGQSAGGTESGVYDMTQTAPTRSASASYFIPSENEFYKAAYYDPTRNGTGGYWEFGTRSDTQPTGQAPGTGTNIGNLRNADGVYWQDGSTTFDANVPHFTPVGAYANSSSYYGLLDIDGNAYQWTERFFTFNGNQFPIYRGGAWYFNGNSAGASHRNLYSFAQSASYGWFGFRIAAPAPVEYVWTNSAGGNWSSASNWTPSVPDAVGASVRFGSAIASTQTVTLDSPRTVGGITFDNAAASYALVGTSTLTIDVASGQASLNSLAGQHSIAVPIALSDDLLATVAGGSQLTISGAIAGAGRKLTKADAGRLVVGPMTVSQLDVQAGQLAQTSAVNGTWTVGQLDVATGASIDLGSRGTTVWDYAGTSPFATLESLVTSGKVLTTAPGVTIGFGESAGLPVSAALGADTTAVIVRVTLAGDANLDRTVNFDDLLLLAANYNASATVWTRGDFNRDGTTNFDDLLLLAANYNQNAPAALDAGWALAGANVPEPAFVGFVAAALSASLARRRNENKPTRTPHQALGD